MEATPISKPNHWGHHVRSKGGVCVSREMSVAFI